MCWRCIASIQGAGLGWMPGLQNRKRLQDFSKLFRKKWKLPPRTQIMNSNAGQLQSP